MDATALTVVGTGVALFVALWRVQGNRFDTLGRHIDRRFEAVDRRFEAVDKQFEAADKQFEAADKQLEAADKRWAEGFEAVERQSQATHSAVCALNGRFDDLCRHLLGPRAQTGQPGPAPAAG